MISLTTLLFALLTLMSLTVFFVELFLGDREKRGRGLAVLGLTGVASLIGVSWLILTFARVI